MSVWLVQRLTRRAYPSESSKGVDKFFGMDYMGSAEFEFGALPKALKRMRADPKGVGVHEIKADMAGKAVKAFYVGPQELLGDAELFFADQIGPQKYPLKEVSLISYVYEKSSRYDPPVGWWAIDDDIRPWAIFTTREYAQKWLELGYTPKEQA